MTQEERNILKESIKGMVRESIFDLMNGGMAEKKSSEKKENDDKPKKKESEEDPGTRSKLKRRIIQYLKDEKTDIAPYAYELWPDKDEDSARSYFYKCLDNKTNDEGDVYSFSDDEFNRLHSMITDRSMKK